MTASGGNWREDRQDERIYRLEGDLRAAQEKIRVLERRPLEWILKIELLLVWIMAVALWVFVIVDAANKH